MCTDPNNWGQEVWSCHQMNCKSLQVLDLRDGQTGTSLEVQWLRLCASYAGSTGLIAGCGTKIPHTTWRSQKIKLRKKNTQKTHSLHKKHSDARWRRDTLNKFSLLFLTLTRCHWEWVSICIEEESEAQRGQATSPRVHSHEATDQGAGASSVDSRMQGPAYDTSLPLSPHLCPTLVSLATAAVQALSPTPPPWQLLQLPLWTLSFPSHWGFSSHSTALHGYPKPQCGVPGPPLSAQCLGPSPLLLTYSPGIEQHNVGVNAVGCRVPSLGTNPSSEMSKLCD